MKQVDDTSTSSDGKDNFNYDFGYEDDVSENDSASSGNSEALIPEESAAMVATTAPSSEILFAVENIMRLAENGSDAFAELPEMVAHAMSLLTMKQRKKGSHRQDLKAMSLKA